MRRERENWIDEKPFTRMTASIHYPGGIGRRIIIVVVICSIDGIRFLLKGIRNDILDASGLEKAPRWVYLATGVALQIPAILYAFAVNRANQ